MNRKISVSREMPKVERPQREEAHTGAPLTKSERHIAARDYFTREIKDFAARGGTEMTHEQAQQKASQIAERATRKKNGE